MKTLNQHYKEWKEETGENKSYKWFIENWCFKEVEEARDGFIPFTKQEMKDRERAFKHVRELFRKNKLNYPEVEK